MTGCGGGSRLWDWQTRLGLGIALKFELGLDRIGKGAKSMNYILHKYIYIYFENMYLYIDSYILKFEKLLHKQLCIKKVRSKTY